ncbi:putative CBEL-like protein [Phytophthora cinnamomi]|uniref:putative CBEL-like protein n=1 Tax=Phytophthora cinnamomi TaxID=4785 RepID=UPI00355A4E36|nr:putative CBEL-like protein [Phytophthora cinnamomi]
MKIPTATFLFAASASTISAACEAAAFAPCGSDSGITCCPDGYYCQPWDSTFYQCVQPPTQCPQQLTNIDLCGNDIKTVYGIQPSDCCSQCAEAAGCVAYTFVNSNPGSPACYLKSATGEPRASTGAVSSILATSTNTTVSPVANTTAPAATTATPVSNETESTPPPSPANNCLVGVNEQCGSSQGVTCCPDGYYCQPWSSDYYQCITPPSKCSHQETDVDYNGNDIKTVFVNQPSLCCDECAVTEGCTAYTYINSNPGQPVCYLKSGSNVPQPLVGAVSGRLN